MLIDVAVALAVHVVAVVWWLGGVAFVTTIILPRLSNEDDPQSRFRDIERRFSPQARIAVLLVGLSGIYLLWRLDACAWFEMARYWWLSAMSAYWLLFFFILFLAEPLKVLGKGEPKIGPTWIRKALLLHRILLTTGLIIVGAAVIGTVF